MSINEEILKSSIENVTTTYHNGVRDGKVQALEDMRLYLHAMIQDETIMDEEEAGFSMAVGAMLKRVLKDKEALS